MPRAPGSASQQAAKHDAEAAAAKGRNLMLFVLLVVVVGAAAAWYWTSQNKPEDRAQQAFDSLRAMAAGPPRADTTKFVDPSDYTPIRRARALRNALDNILSTRAPLMGFAPGPLDTGSTDRAERRRSQQYALFAERWHERLDRATAGGTDFRYAPGTRMGPQMESVTNQLAAALSVMRDMVPRDRVKSMIERRDDAVSVRGYLNSASTTLTNLPR